MLIRGRRAYGIGLLLRVGLFVLVLACGQAGQASISYAASFTTDTYYVDGIKGSDANPGTQAAPWQTIQKAADVMEPGDVLIVPPGTYNERVVVTRSGADGAPITYRAEGAVTMRGFTVYADYINIIGFEITDTDNDWVAGLGIYVKGSNCLIEGNYIHDCTQGGIKLAHDVNNPDQTSNCIVRNNLLDHNSQLGIEVHGRYHTVENNEVSRSIQYHPKWPNPPDWVDADGMRYFGSGHVFRQNYIHDISFTAPENIDPHIDCFQTWSDDHNEVGHDIVFEQNFCKILEPPGAPDTATRGLIATSGAYNLTLKNNVFLAYIGVTLQDSANCILANNTFASKTDFPGGVVSMGLELIRADLITAKNNIFYNIGCTINPIDSISQAGLDAGYNCVYRSDGVAPHGSPYPNDLWNVDPKFIDAGADDFQLRDESPVIDAGMSLVYVNDDFSGNLRPQNLGVDVGAYEWASSSAGTTPGMHQVFIPSVTNGIG